MSGGGGGADHQIHPPNRSGRSGGSGGGAGGYQTAYLVLAEMEILAHPGGADTASPDAGWGNDGGRNKCTRKKRI